MPKFLVYYTDNNGDYKVIKSDDDQVVHTVERLPRPKEYKRFHAFKGYEQSDDGLKKFYDDFVSWDNELKNNDEGWIIKYIDKYYSHFHAVEGVLKTLIGNEFNNHEPISLAEDKWIENCNNGGLLYVNPGTYNCFGYDFVSNYPNILNSKEFKIPTCKGTEFFKKKIEEEAKNIKLGYYRCIISCDDNNFKKVMTFSKNNTYTSHTLKFLKKYQNKYNIKIELIQDGKPNAYLYNTKTTRVGNDIFFRWYRELSSLKIKFPKNKLVKHLLSSAWGTLTRRIRYFKTADELINMDIGEECDSEYGILNIIKKRDTDIYEIIKWDNKNAFNCRIKALLTSAARVKTAELALKDINNVVRICVDNVVFTREQNINTYTDLKKESKTSGLITWTAANRQKIEDKDEYKDEDEININEDEININEDENDENEDDYGGRRVEKL
jgi:hypothetical protein